MNFVDDNMKQKWKPVQHIEISMHEIFAFQDKLDAVKDDPEKVWDVVDDFFMEAENQLELSPGFIKELQELDLDSDFTSLDVDNFDALFKDEDFKANHTTAQDYVNYVMYVQCKNKADNRRKYIEDIIDVARSIDDIPFTPRHNF